jgi:hypothetical protein
LILCKTQKRLPSSVNFSKSDPFPSDNLSEGWLSDEKRTGLYARVPSTFMFLPLSFADQDGKITSAAKKLELENDNPAAQKTFKLQKEWLADSHVPFLECAE